MFGKFFSSAFTGSMCGSGAVVFAVWGYVIANAVDSQIELNPKLLAAIIGAPEQDIINAIEFLCAPDHSSRSKAEEGRRLIKEGSFAYRVVNHTAYRNILNETDRRDYNRRKKAEQRARERSPQFKPKLKSNRSSMTVNDCQGVSAYTEAETVGNDKILHKMLRTNKNSHFEDPDRVTSAKILFGDPPQPLAELAAESSSTQDEFSEG